MVRVGAVSERARLGHRPRGLLRERRRLGIVPARPRALPRVPLERGRDGRHLGHPPRALPRARALERRGPDPEGADVRPDGAAGEPRRGRQGVLVVPRGPAEPRAPALALPLPAGRLPYDELVHHGRGLQDPELELLDTGAFDDDRYWSVDVTYAKASPTEILARIVVENHAAEEATLDVLPTLWFRNTWSWGDEVVRPRIEGDGSALVVADHALAGYRLEAAPGPERCARRRRSSARTRRTRRASSGRTRPRSIRRTASTTTSSRARRRSTRTGSAPRRRSAIA